MSRSQADNINEAVNLKPRFQVPNGADVIDTIEALYKQRQRPKVELPGRPIPGLSSPGSEINRHYVPKEEKKVVRRSLPNEVSRVQKLRNAITL